jgi:hypothetical protein
MDAKAQKTIAIAIVGYWVASWIWGTGLVGYLKVLGVLFVAKWARDWLAIHLRRLSEKTKDLIMKTMAAIWLYGAMPAGFVVPVFAYKSLHLSLLEVAGSAIAIWFTAWVVMGQVTGLLFEDKPEEPEEPEEPKSPTPGSVYPKRGAR